MTQKIIIPLDGSELAEQALNLALGLSWQDGTELILLRSTPIVPPSSVGSPDMMTDYDWSESQDLTTQFHEQTKAYMAEMAEKYGEKHPNLHTRVEMGDPATVIIDVAEEESADLIIMSTRGHDGFAHLMLGSVTERVLHHGPCPVLAVRDGKPLKKILVTLDGSELSEAALEPAMNTARRLGAEVTLLQVVEKLKDEDAGYLAGVAARFADDDGQPATVTLYGSPVTQILNHIQENEIDLVVMSTHGRSGIRRWLYGSVSEKLLRHAPCAVMIVRSD